MGKALGEKLQTRKRLTTDKPTAHEGMKFLRCTNLKLKTVPRNSRTTKPCNKYGGFGHNLGVCSSKKYVHHACGDPIHFRCECPLLNQVRVTALLDALDEANDNGPEDVL